MKFKLVLIEDTLNINPLNNFKVDIDNSIENFKKFVQAAMENSLYTPNIKPDKSPLPK